MLVPCKRLCVIYDTVKGHISSIIRFVVGIGGSEPLTTTFPKRLRPLIVQHFKIKTLRHLLSLSHCEVFSITPHFACFNVFIRQSTCSRQAKRTCFIGKNYLVTVSDFFSYPIFTIAHHTYMEYINLSLIRSEGAAAIRINPHG